jgi:hypothetical protein
MFLATTDRSYRARRVVESLGIIWLLCLADLFFTLWAHAFTPFYELNPIARSMLQADQIGLLILFKLGATAAATLIFWRLRNQPQTETALWLMVSVYTLVLVKWSNYTTVVAMM